MATITSVKRELAVRIVPLIPFVISWLRHKEALAADLFVRDVKNVDESEAMAAWEKMIKFVDQYGDLTTFQLRKLCLQCENAVWAKAVLMMFMKSEPRIVPSKVTEGLFRAVGKIKNVRDDGEVALVLNPELDKMKLTSRDALGEFCALVRDTSQDPRYNATSLGPSIFLEPNYNHADLAKASRVMNLLVEHASMVFGKSGSRVNFDPMGVRRADYDEESRTLETGSQFSGNSKNPKEMADALSEAGFL